MQDNNIAQLGIKHADFKYIKDVLKQHLEVELAYIFGSRAIGNYKKGSDIDIAIKGEDVGFSTISSIKDLLQEESPMPYLFDIVDYTHCKSLELKEHIDTYGVIIYKKNSKQ